MADTTPVTTTAPKSEPKDVRYRRQHFPQADQLVFQTTQKGFVPLPILFRKLIRHMSPPEIRALIYLHLRASRHGICYPTQEEMAYELGLQGPKNLISILKKLVSKRLISTKTSMGKKFYLIHDPRVALQHMVDAEVIKGEELDELNQLCSDLKQPLFAKSTATIT